MSTDSRSARVWIVHRDERARAALARLAGASDDALLGGPGDPHFESAEPPRAVVLGLGGDFERELGSVAYCKNRGCKSHHCGTGFLR